MSTNGHWSLGELPAAEGVVLGVPCGGRQRGDQAEAKIGRPPGHGPDQKYVVRGEIEILEMVLLQKEECLGVLSGFGVKYRRRCGWVRAYMEALDGYPWILAMGVTMIPTLVPLRRSKNTGLQFSRTR